jgi:hypothetical protein
MRVRSFFFILIGLAAGFLLWEGGWRPYVKSVVERLQGREADTTRSSPVFYTLDGKWMWFSVPPGEDYIQFVLNANMASATHPQDDTVWSYSVEYRVLNSAGEVLDEREYFFRTRYTEYVDVNTNEPIDSHYYLDANMQPLGSQSLRINFADYTTSGEDVAAIQIRPKKLPEPLLSLSFRAYISSEIDDSQLRYQWRRLSQKSKAYLAQHNVYDFDLLTEQEKMNLLKNMTQKLAPRGVQGVDYQQKILYQDNESVPIEDLKRVRSGFTLFRGQHGFAALPAQRGIVTIELIPFSSTPESETIPDTLLRQYGPSIEQKREWTISSHDLVQESDQDWLGGSLEIIPGYDTQVRIFFRGEGVPEYEITPENNYLTTYRLHSQQSLNYAVYASDDRSPFRVDIRLPYRAEGELLSEAGAKVECRFLDSNNKRVEQTTLTVVAEPSLFDHINGEEAFPSISDPMSFYFSLPPSVAAVELASTNPVLVACYNRPARLKNYTIVPDDYIPFAASGSPRRNWFYLHPQNREDLMRAQEIGLIQYQPRPPTRNEEILSGNYEWESFQPVTSWRGRQLLVPAQATEIRRIESLPSVYQNVPVRQRIQRTFVSPLQERFIQPTLMVLPEGGEAVPFALELDGEIVLETTVVNQREQLVLPEIATGEHTIQIRTSAAASFLLNSCALVDRAIYMKRLVVRVDEQPLDFMYTKQTRAEETVSIRWFSPAGAVSHSVLHIALDKVAHRSMWPFSSWTFTDRLFEIHPQQGVASIVLDSRTESCDQGQAFFFPLGEDVPPGSYRIRVTKQSGPTGYILLSRLQIGRQEQRTFFIETEDEYE